MRSWLAEIPEGTWPASLSPLRKNQTSTVVVWKIALLQIRPFKVHLLHFLLSYGLMHMPHLVCMVLPPELTTDIVLRRRVRCAYSSATCIIWRYCFFSGNCKVIGFENCWQHRRTSHVSTGRRTKLRSPRRPLTQCVVYGQNKRFPRTTVPPRAHNTYYMRN